MFPFTTQFFPGISYSPSEFLCKFCSLLLPGIGSSRQNSPVGLCWLVIEFKENLLFHPLGRIWISFQPLGLRCVQLVDRCHWSCEHSDCPSLGQEALGFLSRQPSPGLGPWSLSQDDYLERQPQYETLIPKVCKFKQIFITVWFYYLFFLLLGR